MDKFIISVLSGTFGKKSFQNIYKKMFSLALRGLNYGNLGFGEEKVIEIIANTKEANNGSCVIFDVGANVGEYSELLLNYFKTEAAIFAFEPARKTFDSLCSNKRLNNVSKINIGFGSENGELKLYRQTTNSPLASVYQREYQGETFQEFDIVKIETVDYFCSINNISELLFLKIDVEGYEMEVIKGAFEMIKSGKIKYLQFEFGGTQIHSRTFFKDFWDILSPYFVIHKILKDGFDEIKSYEERLEVFSYSNFLCILK